MDHEPRRERSPGRSQKWNVVGIGRRFPALSVSRKRTIWLVANVFVLLMCVTGAYAITPESVSSSFASRLFSREAPALEENELGVALDRNMVVSDGTKVSLVRAYADTDSVVVSYAFEDMDAESLSRLRTALPKLTDANGTRFTFEGRRGEITSGSNPVRSEFASFEPVEEMAPSDGGRRFELTVHAPVDRGSEPLAFDFEIPVQDISSIAVGGEQTVESKGLPLTLERVEITPVKSEAVICPGFDAPDNGLGWMPVVEAGRVGEAGSPLIEMTVNEGGCATVPFPEGLYGKLGDYWMEVTEIHQNMNEDSPQGESTRGSWKFIFEVPSE